MNRMLNRIDAGIFRLGMDDDQEKFFLDIIEDSVEELYALPTNIDEMQIIFHDLKHILNENTQPR